ncbi:MAG: hypothetical protein WC515_01160 [Candidatus Omnitrophota bacterium]
MKYKTVIEITSDAENKSEALEIVGEYLSGNLVSGVDMKCKTKPVAAARIALTSVVIAALLVTAGLISGNQLRPSKNFAAGICGLDAVQPPLKTACDKDRHAEFKKAWNERQTSEALAHIRK